MLSVVLGLYWSVQATPESADQSMDPENPPGGGEDFSEIAEGLPPVRQFWRRRGGLSRVH